MNYQDELNKIMENSTELALATSVENIPNVRIVNFYYNPRKPGIIYFSTFSDNDKVKEFAKNPQVTFTTVASGDNAHVRSNQATICKSELSVFDLKDEFINKIPGYDQTIEMVGEMLCLYEIRFKEAAVIVDMENSGIVRF